MIDLHTHMLPGVDDGSPDMATSLAMADMACRSGIDAVCLTPHSHIPGVCRNIGSRHLYGLVQDLRGAVQRAGIPLDIYRGMEILAEPDLPERLRDGSVWTYNRTRYFLVEFPFDENPDYCDDILRRCVDAGFYPVVAHPARYFFVQEDPAVVWQWYMRGYGIQINKESILGRFGRAEEETAMLLLRHGLVSIVSTDAHGIRNRTPDAGFLRDALLKVLGPDYTYMLLEENPRRILQGRKLVGMKPISLAEEAEDSFLEEYLGDEE